MTTEADTAPMKLQQVKFQPVESPLLKFARNVASQYGEDGIIEKIIETIKPERKFCVEFGAWDGKHLSNCFNLISNHRWSGLMIEANAEKFKELRGQYAKRADVETVNRFVEFEGENTLDAILSENFVPDDFGLLSIDIDGNDYHVWESLKKFSPEIVVIEFNPSVPNDIIFVQAKSQSVNQGCSLHALILLGKEKNYELVCTTSTNAIFVKSEHFGKLNIANNHINALHQPMADGRIFHGYDSEVYVVGMPRLIWYDKIFTKDDFQVLPKEKRRFGDAQSN